MNGIRNRTARTPKNPIIIPERVASRAVEKYILDEQAGCHISTYSVASHGYAQIGWSAFGNRDDRNVVVAHRAAWVSAHGQIPAGMTIDHTCKERRCVNVAHLRLLDNYENGRRTAGRDWPLGQCINGHPNADLVLVGNGEKTPRLRCAKCRTMYNARYEAKRRTRSLAA